MKYIPLRDFDVVTNALNFSTADCHVIGGCDLYTTKAAGGDKKLYKEIEHTLESKYESLVRLSASLSPPAQSAPSDDGKGNEKRGDRKRSQTPQSQNIDLSRPSPFGPLSQIGARRTYAYLIATLNASHTDYDFSHLLRPSDFRRERSLRAVMQNVDSTLQHLRPKLSSFSGYNWSAPPTAALANSAPMVNSVGNEVWSPRMWGLIDKEMRLRQCEKYSYCPADDPFEAEEGSIWSMHYFFFNKELKRVCYIYLRGLSVISHSPVSFPTVSQSRSQAKSMGSVSVGEGAGKRASYWLGSQSAYSDVENGGSGEHDDDEIIPEPDDDEIEVPHLSLDDVRSGLVDGYRSYDMIEDEYEEDYPDYSSSLASTKPVRGMSEEIEDAIEM